MYQSHWQNASFVAFGMSTIVIVGKPSASKLQAEISEAVRCCLQTCNFDMRAIYMHCTGFLA